MAAGKGGFQPWGSAVFALPLLLCLAAAAPAAGYGLNAEVSRTSADPAHFDAGARWLSAANNALDAAPQALGLPLTGGQWLLYGGGATLTRPEMRLQASAWTGGLRASRGDDSTGWTLNLAELALEQTYPRGSLLVTAGATGNYGSLDGRLQGPGGHSSVLAPLWGGGLSAGLRWPRETPLGFFVRGSYLWLSGQGDWRGDQAGALGSMRFDLSGPSVTGQVELAF